jgi:hypothetical protein
MTQQHAQQQDVSFKRVQSQLGDRQAMRTLQNCEKGTRTNLRTKILSQKH